MKFKPVFDLSNSDNTIRSDEIDVLKNRTFSDNRFVFKPCTLPSTQIEQTGFQVQDVVKLEGPYKNTFPRKFKEIIVQHAKLYGVYLTAKKFQITRRNIERWCKNGLDRRKGAGRKTTNPIMEQEMLQWVEDYIKHEKKIPKRKYIMVRGMGYSSDKFKASKGWCDKFLKRNKEKLNNFLFDALNGSQAVKKRNYGFY